MGTESLRLRLVFEDRSILTKTQRSDGMNHSWILLKSQQHRTISDVCTHLLNIFKLNRSCPNGIILAMEGFALPPFESTEILKDKEIISVKKKGGETATIETEDEANLLDEVEDDGLEPKDNGLLLLANDNRAGEHKSESEEVDEEQSHDEDSPVETVSKKRKALMRLQHLKKKKQCLGVLDDSEDEIEAEEIENFTSKKQKKIEENNKSVATSNTKLKSPSTVKRSKELQENAEEVNQVTTNPPAKKISRSARRKKTKRQWMKELAKIGKKKPKPISKPEVTKPQNKEANGQPKGLLHWKQAFKQPVWNGDVGPAVTRPGHIRFESFEEDQPVIQSGGSKEIEKWNGSSSNKRGKKWGRDKFSNFQCNVAKRTSKESYKVLFKDASVPVIDLNEFDKLPPCSEPKEGDVIAYRLLELNSSWIPEFSSFRVGRISYYDARDIVLIPVPEYPISLDNMDEDGPNECLYEKDGTLEINYSALVDVRNLKQYDPDATEPVSNAVNQTPMSVDDNAAENLVSNRNDTNKTDTLKDSNPEGEVNPWEQVSQVISKNTEMPEANHLSKVGYESDPWSSCVTVGPTVGPDTNKAESSGVKDGQKDNSASSDPWLNAKNPKPSQETNAGWTNSKTTAPSEEIPEKNCETGSSWGRPWSSFAPLKVNYVKQPTNQNDWRGGISRGGGKPWSRGGRGRGRSGDSGGGRGRGRGRHGNMM